MEFNCRYEWREQICFYSGLLKIGLKTASPYDRCTETRRTNEELPASGVTEAHGPSRLSNGHWLFHPSTLNGGTREAEGVAQHSRRISGHLAWIVYFHSVVFVFPDSCTQR